MNAPQIIPGRRLAAFIMTYERQDTLESYISYMFAQTFPPEKILIVDNSASYFARDQIASLGDPRISYHRVGYNSGPAGAARIGLTILAEEGYDWIYWGDDDDTPNFPDSIACLFEMIDAGIPNLGVVGEVSQYFNRTLGEIIRIPDADLTRHLFIEAPSVAGGQCMLVSSSVVRAGILPDERLFFGLEELDFNLSVKAGGFCIKVHAGLMQRAREKYGRVGFRRPVYDKKTDFNREYYSVRNKLFILRKHLLYTAWLYQSLKELLKLGYGYRYGIRYGTEQFKAISVAMFDSLTGRLGRRRDAMKPQSRLS